MNIVSFASGSKGNCVLVDDGKTRILIDVGITANTLIKKLSEMSLRIDDIDAIFITHEHLDHVRGLKGLGEIIPIYSHPYTLDAISTTYDIPLKNRMENDAEVGIGTLDVIPFPISHDAVAPLGYCISDGMSKFTYLTDTGFISKGAMNILKGSQQIMIESNHDVDLLQHGPYPYVLRQRILGKAGHLSNRECALTVKKAIETGTKKIMLAHLSEQNNLPELAYWTTQDYLRNEGIDKESYQLKIASQYSTIIL